MAKTINIGVINVSIQKHVKMPHTMKLPHKLSQQFKSLLEHGVKHALQPFSKLPTKVQEHILTLAMNKLFRVELAEQELAFLVDQWLKINVIDANYQCYITVIGQDEKHTFRVSLGIEQDYDVSFQSDCTSLLALFSQSIDPDTLFFQRKLLITGDTELGLEIKNFLDDLERGNLPYFIHWLLMKYTQ